eukprot:6180467-Pleurochrysis_carterae.AAC.3
MREVAGGAQGGGCEAGAVGTGTAAPLTGVLRAQITRQELGPYGQAKMADMDTMISHFPLTARHDDHNKPRCIGHVQPRLQLQICVVRQDSSTLLTACMLGIR